MRRLPLRLPRDNRGGKMNRKQFPSTAAHSHGCLIDLPSGRRRICDYYTVALRKNRSLSLEDLRTSLFCHHHELCRPASRRIAQTRAAKPWERHWPHRSQLWIHRYRIFSGILHWASSCSGALWTERAQKSATRSQSWFGPWAENWYPPHACKSGNLSVITEAARLYVDIVREARREATARVA
jgi:hypothetical protein